MRLPRRRPSDADLESWARTGRPSRVAKFLDDDDVTARLDEITQLPATTAAALHAAVEPEPGFSVRTTAAVRDRVGDLERVGTLFGLLGLGIDTVRTFTDPDQR